MNEGGLRNKSFAFGDFELDAESQVLSANGEKIHLPKRPFHVLKYLVENRERLVSRDELLDEFWDGREVYDDTLRKTVGAIRKALNDLEKPPQYIETRYGSGYRFVGLVEELHKNGNGNGKKAESRPQMIVDSVSPSRRRIPYALLTIFGFSLLFFVSLGFYVYFPKSAKNQSPAALTLPVQTVRAVAILPLKNLTGDANNEYFSDGVTENLITELSRANGLKVISRSSTFALKGKEHDPRELGRQLNIDAFVEGSVQKKGETLVINVRLISASDGSVLWTSDDFERPVSNANELEDTIACKLAAELRAELCDGLPKKNTLNSEAYQAYLKGRFQWNKRTPEGIRRSIELYEQAIAHDPGYALAFAGLSESYVQGIWHVPFEPKEVLPKAEAAARRAVELDETLSEGHTALANVYELEWNWAAADKELQRAVELNPRNSRAHHVRAFYYVTIGSYEEALAEIERAGELDPLNLVVNEDKAVILFMANRVDEAFEQWRKTQELDPNFAMMHLHKSAAFEALGDEPAALDAYVKTLEGNGESAAKISEFRQTVSKGGLKAFYRKEIERSQALEKAGKPVSLVGIATCFTLLGQNEEAFKYLEEALNERSSELVLLNGDWRFAPLRSDPRFKSLLKRMGLPV